MVKEPNPSEGGKMKKDNNPNPLIKSDKKNIEDLIRSVMQDYVLHQSNIKADKAKNLNALATLVSEYLSPFIIIGYDIKGNPANLIHAKNQMDADALSAAVNRFILNSIKTDD